jgi:hypothetical protein
MLSVICNAQLSIPVFALPFHASQFANYKKAEVKVLNIKFIDPDPEVPPTEGVFEFGDNGAPVRYAVSMKSEDESMNMESEYTYSYSPDGHLIKIDGITTYDGMEYMHLETFTWGKEFPVEYIFHDPLNISYKTVYKRNKKSLARSDRYAGFYEYNDSLEEVELFWVQDGYTDYVTDKKGRITKISEYRLDPEDSTKSELVNTRTFEYNMAGLLLNCRYLETEGRPIYSVSYQYSDKGILEREIFTSYSDTEHTHQKVYTICVGCEQSWKK